MIVFNLVGAVMGIVSLAIGMGVAYICGVTGDPSIVLIGSLCILFDVTYRIHQPDGHWMSPFGGGHIMFAPMWVIGALSIAVGIYFSFILPVPNNLLGIGIIGLLVAAALGLAVLQLVLCKRADSWKIDAAEQSSATQEQSSTDEEATFPARSRSDGRERRCPACKLPSKSDEFQNGKCPWCGVGAD